MRLATAQRGHCHTGIREWRRELTLRRPCGTGNTVRLQYSSGIYKIASWAHITNAHLVPGEGILTGLASVGEPLGRGLLLLAEMSAKGNLATGEYTAKNVEAARRYPKFVMGFVAMRRVDEREETAGGVAPGEGVGFLATTPRQKSAPAKADHP